MSFLFRVAVIAVIAGSGVRAGIHAERLRAAGIDPWTWTGVEHIAGAVAADIR